MSANETERLLRALEREKKAREILEREVEEKTRRHYVLFEYHQKVFDAVGVCILHLDAKGALFRANKFAVDNLLSGFIKEGDDVLNFLRIEGQIPQAQNLSEYLDQELEIIFVEGPGKRKAMGARITKLIKDTNNFEFLLTMKDLQEIRTKDQEIKELQNQLVDSAYRDGVAENAVSVLHNIGNILTTINGKMSNEIMLKDLSLFSTVLSKMSSTVESFNSPEDFSEFILKDPKGKAIPKLIRELAKSAINTEKVIQETFVSVKMKCSNISEVITAQQNYANFKDKTKAEIKFNKILGDCLMMHRERISSREIELNIGEIPKVSIYMEKIGLAQTLSNAIMNSIEAIDERFSKDAEYSKKKIEITAELNSTHLIVKISDNGIGIPSEILKNLFQFGFSTKNRSSGFGLHNCANFMNSNNGRMNIISDGPNLGASTLLYCPIFKEANV